MNEYNRACNACHIGIKASQNIRSSLIAFNRIVDMNNLNDAIAVSAYFHTGVIMYAKSFLNSKTEHGVTKYPIKNLKKNENFNIETHNHLIKIRHTLIAHDDLIEVTPKILFSGPSINGFHIPTQVNISNKHISHPKTLKTIVYFTSHIKLVFDEISLKLVKDLERLRKTAIKYPEQHKESVQYKETLSKNLSIPVGGKHFEHPDVSGSPWLNVTEPDFVLLHDGFYYNELTVTNNISEPEMVELPDGGYLEVTPSNEKK